MLAPLGPTLLLALTLVSAPQGSVTPALPKLALETFPAAARDAVSRLYREATAHPGDAARVGALGRTLHAWEQWDSAHLVYLRARAMAPSAFEWHYLDGVVLQRLARHVEAAAAFRRALELDATYLPARVKLPETLLEAGEMQASEELFSALTAVSAAEPAAEVGLGRIDASRDRHAEAARHFERAVALVPELGAAHYGLARSYRALDRPADAQRELELHRRYGAFWPKIDDPLLAAVASVREDARAALARGVALASAGEVKAAIEAHEQALERDPSLAQAHANLVGLYGRAGNWQKAEAHYRAAAQDQAGDANLHYDYGVVLGLQEKWDAAAEAYRMAIAVNPLHAQARNNLGQLLERRRDIDAAAAEYRQAVEAQPTFRLARFNLGRMLLARGETTQALAEFEKIQQPVDAETPRYLFALSTAMVRAGRMTDGLRTGTEASRLALEFGQQELARAIENELSKLK